MRDKDWLRFLTKAGLIVLRGMILGAIIVGGIGLLIAAAAAFFGGAGPLTPAYLAPIVLNYVQVGLFGGGIIGLLYGLLSQGSY